MVSVIYFVIGALLCAALFAGWYWLSGTVLRYIRISYPEQSSDLPNSLFASGGWNSAESRLIRAILSKKSVYYYDERMQQYRIILIIYFVLCVTIGIGYVLYPILAGRF